MLDEKAVSTLLDVSIGKDNQSCTANATYPVLSDYSKHVDLKYRYLEDDIGNGAIGIHNLPTEEMVASALTKSLSAEKFNRFPKMMGTN